MTFPAATPPPGAARAPMGHIGHTCRLVALAGLTALCLIACGDDDGDSSRVCEEGQTRACGCASGVASVRTCLDDGSDFGECDCDNGPPPTGGSGGSPGGDDAGPTPAPPGDAGPTSTTRCGDGQCDEAAGETCARCELDCGECPAGGECGDDGGACEGCGDGVCAPGEDETCSDCATVQATCDDPCTDHTDCAQPWTSCIGGGGRCIPNDCQGCFNQDQFCCFCDAMMCSGVACAPSLDECPPCS